MLLITTRLIGMLVPVPFFQVTRMRVKSCRHNVNNKSYVTLCSVMNYELTALCIINNNKMSDIQ